MMKSERGSTTPLLIFYCFLGLTVIALIVAATSLYIERKRLFALADGAALAATEQFQLRNVSFEAGEIHIRLQSADVWAAANSYVADAHTVLDGVRIVRAESPDGTSARVELSSVWRPPIVGELFPWALTLRVTSTARTAFG